MHIQNMDQMMNTKSWDGAWKSSEDRIFFALMMVSGERERVGRQFEKLLEQLFHEFPPSRWV
jgi:hypothetical protein